MPAQTAPEAWEAAWQPVTREAGGPVQLPPGWVCGRDCVIGGAPGRLVTVNLVLMHPRLGIALIERGQATMDAEEVLRARLREAQFASMFSGHLPILHCVAETLDAAALVGFLESEFAGQPPLFLPGGKAWVSAATQVITPGDRTWMDNLGHAPRAAYGEFSSDVGDKAPSPSDPGPGTALLRKMVVVRGPDIVTAAADPHPEAAAPGLRHRHRHGRAATASIGLLALGMIAIGWASLGSQGPAPAAGLPQVAGSSNPHASDAAATDLAVGAADATLPTSSIRATAVAAPRTRARTEAGAVLRRKPSAPVAQENAARRAVMAAANLVRPTPATLRQRERGWRGRT